MRSRADGSYCRERRSKKDFEMEVARSTFRLAWEVASTFVRGRLDERTEWPVVGTYFSKDQEVMIVKEAHEDEFKTPQKRLAARTPESPQKAKKA